MSLDPNSWRTRLAARPRQALRLDGFAEAAVLVPILIERQEPERLLFTVRNPGLPTHAGQISFPGGKREAADPDAVATAVRETHEELGIAPEAIEVVGLLDDLPTPTGFVITPVVACVRGPVQLAPNPAEVSEVFTCGLDELAATGCYGSSGVRHFRGVDYVMHEYRFGRHLIWGATARMAHQLLELFV